MEQCREAKGVNKHDPEPPAMDLRAWLIAIGFWAFVALVIWRLGTRT